MRICSICGERNEDWMDICQRCGGSITNANVDNSYDTPVDDGNNYNDYRGYNDNYYDDNNNNYYQDSSKSSDKLPKERKRITNLDLKIILVILIIILVCLIIYAFF